jgi:hypothetical protein
VKNSALLFLLIVLYLCLIFPFTSYLKNKPLTEKVGYVPQPEVLIFATADQKQSTAASLIMKVLFYFGGLTDQAAANRIYIPPDFPGMRNMFEAAVKLDPYNMDGYYFAQAVMVWDMKEVRAANDLLEYGMKYRDWDWYLPYFAGFNYGYFLHDYGMAAKYFKRVGALTGNELSINLAGRYMYESDRTDLAISYLAAMEKSATNEAIKKSFRIRLEAFRGVKLIESARDAYRKRYGRLPKSVGALLEKGYLRELPIDPYGGTFYIDEKGHVRSTSKFAFAGKK